MSRLLHFSALLLMLLATGLTGCASGPAAVLHTLREGFSTTHGADRVPLDPALQYLRVTRDGNVALMVLGNVDPHPDGPIEVWYSAEREVLRLQNGRLAGAAGMTEEWRAVRLQSLPDWPTLSERSEPYTWVRVRDVMPGYRSNITDQLSVKIVDTPRSTALRGIAASDLVWFEETLQGGALPPARYAVHPDHPEQVVYGEQCISTALCLHWQRWPATRADAQQ